jgi:hypothetical protein
LAPARCLGGGPEGLGRTERCDEAHGLGVGAPEKIKFLANLHGLPCVTDVLCSVESSRRIARHIFFLIHGNLFVLDHVSTLQKTWCVLQEQIEFDSKKAS